MEAPPTDWKSFLSSDNDGNAKIKTEYIFEKTRTLQVCEKESGDSTNVQPANGKPNKKNKARGQNKNRPRRPLELNSEKLCPSKVTGTCMFGEKCKYMHNIEDYMKIKPTDIGDKCHAYRTHGKCNYGFTCRYGGDHIEKNENEYINQTNNEKELQNPMPVITNSLPRELQVGLRKRKVNFDRTVEALKCIEQHHAKRKKGEVILTPNENARVDHQTDIKSSVTTGPILDTDVISLRKCEKKTIDFRNKLYLAPLTTCGNLPFRVMCKQMGADITCGEMALATNLLQGQTSEWALIKRHPCEDIFGVQLCGAFPDTMSRCAELLNKNCDVDFIDINMGCPIDLIYHKGAGSALMRRTNKLFDVVTGMTSVLDIPLTCKLRTGIESKKNIAHNILPLLRDSGVSLATLHGRSREARYTRIADWSYVSECAKVASPMPLFGNGDILSHHDYYSALEHTDVSGIMIARGALIKPWIFTEIKEQRDWDISSTERLDIIQKFANEGLLHWGSDTRGVETTRRFLLEWLSFLHRYIPVGILETVPQRINERPPYYVGRNDLETLFASPNSNDWIKISEMVLGRIPDNFSFLPKHKANSYK
uniref:tRNA-dihydrouridine(47) synthase [NAD(P)(+)] n=1 Tax=Phallusia mammillata TaxID=59560 RepID=A0A6F9DC27_9ASCI|nr:ZF(C3H)-5 zinc finger protein [Phallusia mammillata]